MGSAKKKQLTILNNARKKKKASDLIHTGTVKSLRSTIFHQHLSKSKCATTKFSNFALFSLCPWDFWIICCLLQMNYYCRMMIIEIEKLCMWQTLVVGGLNLLIDIRNINIFSFVNWNLKFGGECYQIHVVFDSFLHSRKYKTWTHDKHLIFTFCSTFKNLKIRIKLLNAW